MSSLTQEANQAEQVADGALLERAVSSARVALFAGAVFGVCFGSSFVLLVFWVAHSCGDNFRKRFISDERVQRVFIIGKVSWLVLAVGAAVGTVTFFLFSMESAVGLVLGIVLVPVPVLGICLGLLLSGFGIVESVDLLVIHYIRENTFAGTRNLLLGLLLNGLIWLPVALISKWN